METNNIIALKYPICKESELIKSIDNKGLYVYESPQHCIAHLLTACRYLRSVLVAVPPRTLARYLRMRKLSVFDTTFPQGFNPHDARHIATLAVMLQDMAAVVKHDSRYSYADVLNLATNSLHLDTIIK